MKKSDVIKGVDYWYATKDKIPRCPFCQCPTLTLGIVCRLQNAHVKDSYFDIIPITCSDCQLVFFLSAGVLDAVPPPDIDDV